MGRQPIGGPPRPAKRRWWIPVGAAALVVVLAAGGFFLFQTLRPPQPIEVSDAGELLLAPRDFQGDWQTFPDASSIAMTVLGRFPEDADPEPSGIADCLDLPILDHDDRQESGVYTTTSGVEGNYALVQTAGFVMPSEAAASGMVDHWRSPDFDQCFSEAESSLFYYFGEESSDYDKSVQFLEPDFGTDLPETVDAAYRRLVFPLTVNVDGDTEELDRYFDLIALSAGTSVIYLFVQSDYGELSADVRDAAVQSLVSRLVE